MDCYITIAPSGKASRVLANNGKESELFTSLLSVPFIENGTESIDLYGKLIALDFLKEKHIQDDNGEPKLYFMAGNSNVNPLFESFANAKAAYPNSPIIAGFAKHGKLQEYNSRSYAPMNQFTPIASFANILSDGNTKNDIINNLIVTGAVKGKMSWGMKLKDKVKSYLDFQVIGEKGAKNVDLANNNDNLMSKYEKAIKMEKELGISESDWMTTGAKREEKLKIRLETGWDKDAGNQWAYEVEDFTIKDGKTQTIIDAYNSKQELDYKVSDLFDVPIEIEQAHPTIKDLTIKFITDYGNIETEGYIKGNTIYINRVKHEDFINGRKGKNGRRDVVSKRLLNLLNHEIAHSIQQKEGFFEGGDTNRFNLEYIFDETGGINAIDRDNVYKLAEKMESLPKDERRDFIVRDIDSNLKTLFILLNKSSNAKLYLDTIFNDSLSDYEKYERLAGEVNARNIGSIISTTRGELSKEERAYTLLEDTEDVNRQDVIRLNFTYPTPQEYRTSSPTSNTAKAVTEYLKSKGFPLNILSEQQMIEEARKLGYENFNEVPNTLTKGERIYGFYNPQNNQIYLTEEVMNSDTLTHELWHFYRPILVNQAASGNKTTEALLKRFDGLALTVLGGEDKLKEYFDGRNVTFGKTSDIRLKANDTQNNINFAEISNKLKNNGLQRLSKESEQGRSESGEINAISTIISAAVQRNVQEKYGVSNANAISETKRLETNALEQYANDNGLIVSLPNSEVIGGGNESDIYEHSNPNLITKVTFPNNYNSWLEMFDSIAIHNAENPTTQIKINGFATNKDGEFSIITEQNLIQGVPPQFKTIHEDLISKGYELSGEYGDGRYIHREKGIVLEDVKEDNVLEDNQGNLHYIDTDFYPYDKQRGGNLVLSELPDIRYATSSSPFSSEVYAPRQNETFDAYKDRMMEETMARILGQNSDTYFERIAKEAGLNDKETKSFLEKVKQFILDFADWLGKQLGLTDVTPEQIASMTNKELFDKVITSMLRGDYLNSNIEEAIKRNNGNPLNLAPNGKPSILYQSYKGLGYSDVEAESLTAQIFSDSFLDFFGDWINNHQNASKVVDENGQPLLLAHSTNEQFTEFTLSNFGKTDEGFFGRGFYFSPTRVRADNVTVPTMNYGKNKMYVFLNIKNPQIDGKTFTFNRENELSELKDKDGVFSSSNLKMSEFVVRNPNQIKSATENIGTFNENYNDIRFSIVGERAASNVENYKKSLEEAKSMEENGASPIEIESKTKWYKYQGQWRTLSNEAIRDFRDIKLPEINKKTNLKTILGNENVLLKMYPNLGEYSVAIVSEGNKNVPQKVKNALKYSSGIFNEEESLIYINSQNELQSPAVARDIKHTLIHEVQHIIQKEEKMPVGGNLKTISEKAFKLMGIKGEITQEYLKVAIESRDKAKFSDNDNKFLDRSVLNIEARVANNIGKLVGDYESLMGEIDANIASEALNSLYFVGDNFEIIYSKYLNDYLYLKNITEKDIISIYDSAIQANIVGEVGASSLNDSLQTMDNLAIAKKMLAKNKSPKTIKNATGWEYFAPENKWKLELNYGTTKNLPRLREIAANESFSRKHVNNVSYKLNGDNTYDVKMYNTESGGGSEGRKIEYSNMTKEDLVTMLGSDLANDIVSEKGVDVTEDWGIIYGEYAEKAFEINKKYPMSTGNAIKLSSIFVAPELFKAFPKLKNVDVVVSPLKSGEAAWDGENIILAPQSAIKNDKYIRSILIHEVQHFIQDQEGFARGGTSMEMQTEFTHEDEFILGEYADSEKSSSEFLSDPNVKYLLLESPEIRSIIENKTKLEVKLTLKDAKLTASEKYKRLAGEVEARNVQARAEMSKAKRLRTLLSETEDIAPEDKIYLYGSTMASSESPLKDKIIAKRKELAKAELRKQKFEANVAKNTTQQLDMFAPNIEQGSLFEIDKSQIQKDYQLIRSDVARISSELNALINESQGVKVDPNQLDLFAPLNLDTTVKQDIEFNIATNPKYIADALIQGGYVQQDCSL